MGIETLIERLRTESLYADKASLEIMELCMEAATALSTLQLENKKLRDELEQVKAERDAAVSDLETVMAYGGGNLDTCTFCKNGQCYGRGGTKLCNPEWRGPEKEN